MRLTGLLCVPIGLVLVLAGVGTSDMEMAKALTVPGVQAHILTGVPLALVGIGVLLLASLLIKADPQR